MAERVEKLKSVRDLGKRITCALCNDYYTEPKALPCLHYYCKQCLRTRLVTTSTSDLDSNDRTPSCVKCHREIILPQGGVDSLPTVPFVNRMKETYMKLERAHGRIDAVCDVCSEDKAEAFCQQCSHFICLECISQHRRMKKLFPGHKIISFEEMKEGMSAKDFCMSREYRFKSCKIHEEPMKIYCYDCNALICHDCTVQDHFGHNHKFLKKTAPKIQRRLVQQLEPLMEVNDKISYLLQEIHSIKEAINTQGYFVASDIGNSFEELQEILKQREEELLKEASMKLARKLRNLSEQERSLSNSSAVIQGVIEYTQQYVEHSTLDEVMSGHAELERKIEKETKKHCRGNKSWKPVEEADMGVEVNCAEELRNLCQSKATTTQISYDCLITGCGVTKAVVNQVANCTLKLRKSTGEYSKQRHAIECYLKSLVDGSIFSCEVSMINDHDYHIQYVPTVRGRHKLIVTIDGQHILGSPFSVFITIPPTDLFKPVKTITDLKKPFDVAVNSRGEIIVTRSKKIDVFSREGTRLSSMKPAKFGITDPTGIFVDNCDNVYIAEYEKRRIVKLNREMKVLRMHSSKETSGLFGLTMVGRELMACDYKTNSILVFSNELKFLREISSDINGLSGIRDVSSDDDGNLYISDYVNSCIQVLNREGEFLRSFGCDENGENRLSGPSGVCVAGQHVYVANFNNHMISVFTTRGEYVTSFGQEGSSKGDFNCSWGVFVDKDGFIYVCDNDNHRIQIF